MPLSFPTSASSPTYKPPPLPSSGIYHYDLTQAHLPHDSPSTSSSSLPPPSLVSPAFTPPSTPGLSTPTTPSSHSHLPNNTHTQSRIHRSSLPIPTDTSLSTTLERRAQLLSQPLPIVHCVVRARIPTTSGAEMFLHLYQNDADNKEHLAIVFGSRIRSESLDREVPGETEMDRMIRGAYVGRLHPGRISSRVDQDTKIKGKGGVVGSKLKREEKGDGNGYREVGGNEQEQVEQQEEAASPETTQLPLVRIHSECYTGETAWSARCDCGEQLDEAARLMSSTSPSSPSSDAGGVIVYLRQEGRGIGLGEKLKAYNLQDLGKDTVEANLLLRHPADARSYGLATAILCDLGLGGDRGIRLLTNNPEKVLAVEGPGREVRVRERVPMIPVSWRTGGRQGVRGEEIEEYLKTKIGKMGHMIS